MHLFVFLTGLVASFLLTPSFRRVAERYRVVDVPRYAKHVHSQPTPRLGGAALYLASLVAVAPTFALPREDSGETFRLVGVLLGATIVFLFGAYDDKHDLSPALQLAAQLLASAIVIGFDVIIRQVTNPFGGPIEFPPLIAAGFTLFWLIGMMTTANWLDGVDGLTVGITVIATTILFFHTFRLGQYSIALLPAALAGCAMGFLPHNFHPARIFLGGSGAYFLAFSLGTLAIIGGAKTATTLLVLGVPIADVAWRIVERLLHHHAPWRADRAHLHQRLYDLGLSQR